MKLNLPVGIFSVITTVVVDGSPIPMPLTIHGVSGHEVPIGTPGVTKAISIVSSGSAMLSDRSDIFTDFSYTFRGKTWKKTT